MTRPVKFIPYEGECSECEKPLHTYDFVGPQENIRPDLWVKCSNCDYINNLSRQ